MESVLAKRIWQVFFILTCGVVVWFLVQFGMKMVPYMQLSQMTHGVVDTLKVEEQSNERYAVMAEYHYQVSGINYKKKYTFTTPIFLNRLAAENHIKQHWKSKEWEVWYSSKDPSQASLQKLFPFKLLFNACLAMGIVFYFMWLRHYVARAH